MKEQVKILWKLYYENVLTNILLDYYPEFPDWVDAQELTFNENGDVEIKIITVVTKPNIVN